MRIDEPKTIIVFRNGSIGNTLVALPAICALKKQFPDSMLTAVLDSTGAELLKHCTSIDSIIIYDKRGKDEGLSAHIRLIKKLRTLGPTHAILFKRFFRNGLLAYLSGAKYRIGFDTNGKAPFLNCTTPYDEAVHIAQLNMNLLALLGIEAKAESYTIPLTDQDRDAAKEAVLKTAKSQRYAVVHYGGSTTSPDFFPVERMRELLQPILKADLKLVFIGSGQSEERLANSAIHSLSTGASLFNLPMRTMAAIIAEAECFVGFNSGPAHIAAGVQTPGLVIYRPDANVEKEIRKWKPLYDALHPIIPPRVENVSEWKQFFEDAHIRLGSIISSGSAES